MGEWLPKTPAKYQPETSTHMQEQLTAAILQELHRRGITAAELSRRIPAVRAAYIKEMRAGMLLGLKRLMAICEALEIKVDVRVYSSKHLPILEAA